MILKNFLQEHTAECKENPHLQRQMTPFHLASSALIQKRLVSDPPPRVGGQNGVQGAASAFFVGGHFGNIFAFPDIFKNISLTENLT